MTQHLYSKSLHLITSLHRTYATEIIDLCYPLININILPEIMSLQQFIPLNKMIILKHNKPCCYVI